VVLPGGVVWYARGYPVGKAHQADDDAQLIAAAPDLLDALERAHVALRESRDGYSDSDLSKVVAAAIARAKGSPDTD
jgi:hypothetical protein